MYIALDNFGDLVKLGLDGEGSVALLQHFYYLGSTPQGFLSSQKGFSLDPTGRLCAIFWTFGSLTNILCPWSSLVTMKTVNSPSVVQSGGGDTTLHIL